MKTLNQVKPEVGMSVSMGIGSDRYHQIIVRITRNGKTIETLSADTVLGGMSYEDWTNAPESIRLTHINNSLAKALEYRKEEYNLNHLYHIYTQKTNGEFSMKGCNYGWLTLNSTREYSDPSF
jgi:hypothetical protein